MTLRAISPIFPIHLPPPFFFLIYSSFLIIVPLHNKPTFLPFCPLSPVILPCFHLLHSSSSPSMMPSSSSFIFILFPFFLLFFLLTLHPSPSVVDALSCVQHQQHLMLPLTVEAKACPSSSVSCSRSYDFAQNISVRACQSTNCTYGNGTLATAATASSPVCFNSSGNTQMYCCCYGDGCNGARGCPGMAPMLEVIMIAMTMIAMGMAGGMIETRIGGPTGHGR